MRSVRFQLLVTLIALILATLFLSLNWPPPTIGLREAAQTSNLFEARQALRWGVRSCSTSRFGEPLLHWAVSNSRPDIVRMLIEGGFDTEADDGRGWTPLQRAITLDGRDMVGLLLDEGADPDAPNAVAHTPLHIAVIVGREDLVGLLIARGATVNIGDVDGWTPLHCAARYGSLTIVRMLVDSGADVNVRDAYGRTPLAVAVATPPELGDAVGRRSLIEFLRAHGAVE